MGDTILFCFFGSSAPLCTWLPSHSRPLPCTAGTYCKAIAEALADDETPAHATLEDGPYPCTASRPMNRTTAGFAIIFAAAFFGRKRQTRSPSADSVRHSGLYRWQGGLHIICRGFLKSFSGVMSTASNSALGYYRRSWCVDGIQVWMCEALLLLQG